MTKTTLLAAALLLASGASQALAEDRDQALRRAGKAMEGTIPELAMPQAVRDSMLSIERGIKNIERRLAGLLPVPNLTVDTRGRKVGCRVFSRENLDVDTGYKIGDSEPSVRFSMRSKGPSLTAQTTPVSKRSSISGAWSRARWTLRGGLSQDTGARKHSHNVGLQYRLNQRQSVEVSKRGQDRRVSWTYLLRFKS